MRRIFNRVNRLLRLALLSWVVLFSVVSPVLAQEEEVEEKKVAYVLSYVLIILCVGGGLAAICRPGKRQRDVPRKK